MQAQCTPDPNVAVKSFKVSDTCAIKGQPFSSVITINIPDTIEVSSVKIPIDSMIVKNIVLGTGTGITVTYNNGNKTIKAKVPYCATLGAPTVTGAKGVYSTRLTGNNKISFSADMYRGGVAVMPIDETLLIQAGLEIRFKIVDSAAECSTFSSVKQLYLSDVQQLKITQNKTESSLNIAFNSSKQETYTISCYDMQGKIIRAQKVEAVIGSNKLDMPAASITSGLYFIEISDGTGKQIQKIIID